jgi:hypothetical protein
VARLRTTKKLAQRVDLNYFKRPTAFKRAKFWLSVLVPLLAVGWIAWRGLARDSRVYSSGRMSEAHAVLERQCAACHAEKAGEFSANAADSACQACHDGPMHHANEVASAVPACATCHVEHRGRIELSMVSNGSCAECHAKLKVASGPVHYAATIHSLEDGHPEFAALRDGAKDPGTIRLNHAIHMKPIRRGPNGPVVQLECGDCHRPSAVNSPWPYEDRAYVVVQTSCPLEAKSPLPGDSLPGPKPLTGRERMTPPKFATGCAGCHLLTFDKRSDEGVPHDKPEIVHAFLVKKFQDYIAAHPSELQVARDPRRDLAGKPILPIVRVLSREQWVAERTKDAEVLLWRKTCKQCHELSGFVMIGDTVAAGWAGPTPETQISTATWISVMSNGERNVLPPLPTIAPARERERWLPHAKFDHDAHRGFSCTGCHAKALTSTEVSDVLVPGIANCQTCHAPGPEHAESRCFECHTYHDWGKRKEVKARFTLPGLVGGR